MTWVGFIVCGSNWINQDGVYYIDDEGFAHVMIAGTKFGSPGNPT